MPRARANSTDIRVNFNPSFTSFLKKDIATTEDLMRKAGLPLTQ